MRAILETPTESDARTLCDILLVAGIGSEVRPTRDGGFHLWVHDERDVARANELIERYRSDPSAAEFRGASERAAGVRRAEQKAQVEARKRDVRMSKQVRKTRGTGMPMVTMTLIIVCVGVAFLTRLEPNGPVVDALSIASRRAMFTRPYGLGDILAGQVWRLVTPIFLHFGFLHVLFNMLWLRDLGTRIERLSASWFLAVMVLVVAVLSNLAELFIGGNVAFGGMSGVVYGLLGFVWMRARFDPASGYNVSRTTVGFMLVWFALCWTGMMGPVANMAHTGGLVVGALWGYLAARQGYGRPGSH